MIQLIGWLDFSPWDLFLSICLKIDIQSVCVVQVESHPFMNTYQGCHSQMYLDILGPPIFQDVLEYIGVRPSLK